VRLLVTGGSGVLGRTTIPLLRAHGHEIDAPAPAQLDLFDPVAVARAVGDAAGILHLATRIPPREHAGEREAWRENDRLRAEASRLLVDAALAAETEAYVQPSITFLYTPEGLVDEETPLDHVPEYLRSALAAEEETALASRQRAGAAPSLRRSPFRAASTTSAATATTSRTSG
jgi:nucleoside-diphosphate-sugar epimerase